jgi:hypothetical protein
MYGGLLPVIYCLFVAIELTVYASAVSSLIDGFFAAYFALSLLGRRIALLSVRHDFSVDSLAPATCS